MRDIMRDVVTRGTATAVRDFVAAEIPVAGKTGTTNDNSDVWFVGMTPEIVAGVWLGFDKPAHDREGRRGRHARRAGVGGHDREVLQVADEQRLRVGLAAARR